MGAHLFAAGLAALPSRDLLLATTAHGFYSTRNMEPRVFLLTALVLFGACCPFASAAELQRAGLLRRVFLHLRWEELPAVVDSPEEICARIRQNVRYEGAPARKPLEPKEVWGRGVGDCRNFASVIADLCRQKGFAAEVRVFTPKEGSVGHAVVIGTWQKRLWFSSNGSYETARSLDEVRDRVAEDLGWR